MKIQVKVKTNPVDLILDSGSAVSLISTNFAKKIGLKATEPSKILISTAAERVFRLLGKIVDLPIQVEYATIPGTFHLIDTPDY